MVWKGGREGITTNSKRSMVSAEREDLGSLFKARWITKPKGRVRFLWTCWKPVILAFCRGTWLGSDILMKSQNWKDLEVSGWDQTISRCEDFLAFQGTGISTLRVHPTSTWFGKWGQKAVTCNKIWWCMQWLSLSPSNAPQIRSPRRPSSSYPFQQLLMISQCKHFL